MAAERKAYVYSSKDVHSRLGLTSKEYDNTELWNSYKIGEQSMTKSHLTSIIMSSKSAHEILSVSEQDLKEYIANNPTDITFQDLAKLYIWNNMQANCLIIEGADIKAKIKAFTSNVRQDLFFEENFLSPISKITQRSYLPDTLTHAFNDFVVKSQQASPASSRAHTPAVSPASSRPHTPNSASPASSPSSQRRYSPYPPPSPRSTRGAVEAEMGSLSTGSVSSPRSTRGAAEASPALTEQEIALQILQLQQELERRVQEKAGTGVQQGFGSVEDARATQPFELFRQ